MKTTHEYMSEYHHNQLIREGLAGVTRPYTDLERRRLLQGYRPPRVLHLLNEAHLPTEEAEQEFIHALASGELLTARQAALAVGVHVGTFNYHVRKGHIPAIPTPGGVRYVRLKDAQDFAEKLKTYHAIRSFDDYLSVGEPWNGNGQEEEVEDGGESPSTGAEAR